MLRKIVPYKKTVIVFLTKCQHKLLSQNCMQLKQNDVYNSNTYVMATVIRYIFWLIIIITTAIIIIIK